MNAINMRTNGVTKLYQMNKNHIDLDNLSFCKAILMLLIAFYHSISYWNGWQNSSLGVPVFSNHGLSILADYFSQIHVYAFVVISGYLFCYLQVEKNKYPSFLGLIRNKVKRLIVPLIFVSIVWLIPSALIFLRYDGNHLLNNFLLMEGPLQLWFLLMLFFVFVGAWPLHKIFSGGVLHLHRYMPNHHRTIMGRFVFCNRET